MQKEKKRKYRFLFELMIVCLLILSGIVLSGWTFGEYGQFFLKKQDEQLVHVAKLIDKNIDGLVKHSLVDLNYVTKRRGFLEAEDKWLKTGETEDLRYRMEENLLSDDDLIASILVIQDETVVLATDDNLEYHFLDVIGSEDLRPCVGADGTIYLALLCEGRENITYAALMNLDEFYRRIAGSELDEYDWIILTDASSEILMYNQQGQLHVEKTDAVTGATCGSEGVEILLSQQKKQIVATSSYEYMDSVTKENYTARMVTLPTGETQNDAFAVGVVTNYEEIIAPLQKAGILLMIFGGMVVVGILLLLNIILRFRRRNERDILELQTLQEKNDAMAELNQQTKELAHLQRLEIIGTLTSGVAHEFNNLLTPIMGYSILTLEQIPTDRTDLQDNILEIYQASRRAKEITSQLSKLSGKNTSDSFEKIVLDNLVENALRVALPATPETVEVKKQFGDDKCCVEGNETQLSQLVLNLILNGFQAMEGNEGILTIATFVKENRVILQVGDTGSGIPKEVVGKIFEPFFTTKEAGKGTGLGLAIVQQVIEDHHGSIRVDTEEGKGTTFTVELPRII